MTSLPIAALPLEPELLSWLGKLGILLIGDLARLERAQLAARLGPRAQDLLALLEGRDDVPLAPYVPPRLIVEEASFDHELHGTEPLLFVLGGLVSRAAVRLEARGDAAGLVIVELSYDRSIARLRGLGEDDVSVAIELPVALSTAEEILQAVRAKIDQLELDAPVLTVRLTLDGLRTATRVQLDLARHANADPNALPTLLAELSAWLGPERVGVLRWADTHRPEAQSQLVPVDPVRLHRAAARGPRLPDEGHPDPGAATQPAWLQAPVPTRILPQPIYVGRLKPDELISVESSLFVIDRLRLAARLDGVEWWTPEPVSRDYARAWVHTGARRQGEQEHSEAWVFVERNTGRGFIHGWFA